jgi:hypothetical protein
MPISTQGHRRIRVECRRADRDGLRGQLTEAQDDLIAARTVLPNMMRDQNIGKAAGPEEPE